MVSPSKKRKVEGKPQAKSTTSGTTFRTAVTGNCRLRRTRKPLSEKRFYLDLKNHAIAARLEIRIKSLGACVDAFLNKDVSYVVTDRPAWSHTTTSPSGTTWSPSPAAVVHSPAELGARKPLQRSRAEAMLEKAKQQTHLNTIDPLENAIRWGISIWPLDKVLKWISRIESSVNNQLSVKSKTIKTPFIKFEDLSRHYRPVYSSLTVWPTLNLDCGEGVCPFSVPKSPGAREHKPLRNAPQLVAETPLCDQRMTRKSRVQPTRNEDILKVKLPVHTVYCEICETNFQDFEDHLKSKTHQKFIQENKNYLDLDTLIKEGPIVEDFLTSLDPIGTRRSPRGVCSPPWHSTSESNSSETGYGMRRPPLSNGQLQRRTSQRQAEERIKAAARKESSEELVNGITKLHPYKSPNDRSSEEDNKSVEITHNLRSRMAPNEDTSVCKRLRSRNSEGSADSDSRDSDIHCVTRSKTEPSRTRQGRNSYDSIVDTNGKQGSCSEDSTCSLQSTKFNKVKGKIPKKKRLSVEEKLLEDNKEYYKLEVINAKLRSSGYFCNQRELENGQVCGEDSVDNEQSSSRTKRPRRSECSVLNDEADSYLFGDRTIKKENLSPVHQNSNRLPLQVHIYTDECANHVPSAPLVEQSMLPTIKEELSPNGGCHSGSFADHEKKKRRTHAELFIHDNLDYYKFPLSESRLRLHTTSSSNPLSPNKTDNSDTGNIKSDGYIPQQHAKINEDNNITKSESEILSLMCKTATPEVVDRMRFSFEHVPLSEPWFQTYKRQDTGDEMVEPYSDFEFEKRYVLPYEKPNENFYNRFGRGRFRGRGRGGMSRKILMNKMHPRSRAMQLAAAARQPRKSPRCHASTLAILSSFVNKRRRQSLGLSPDRTQLPECPDFQEIEKNLDEMLASPPLSPLQESCNRPQGRVRRRSQRRATETTDPGLDDSDIIDVPTVASPVHICSTTLDVVGLFDDFPQCHCTDGVKADILQQQNEQEDDDCSSQRLGTESEECASSTYDTVSESGTNYSSMRGRFKKRKRNLTGWPSKARKKKPKAEDEFLGVRIKMLPIHKRGQVHIMYSTTSARGRARGKRGGSSRTLTSSSPSRRGMRNFAADSPSTASSSEIVDHVRPIRSSTSSSSPRKRGISRKRGAKTRWGSSPQSLRQRW